MAVSRVLIFADRQTKTATINIKKHTQKAFHSITYIYVVIKLTRQLRNYAIISLLFQLATSSYCICVIFLFTLLFAAYSLALESLFLFKLLFADNRVAS